MMGSLIGNLEIRDHFSPNHGPRLAGNAVDMLLLHYTGMRSAEQALARLCDPLAEVSAHYLVDEDGATLRLVPENRRAWHAGRAAWAGQVDINSCSIGIELVNPGHEFGYRRFPASQMASLEQLCRDILARHPVPPWRVLGHGDVAPARKEDPGEMFDWAALARAGVGLWPEATPPTDHVTIPLEALQRGLAALGYAIGISESMNAETRAVILAFQRHWLPQGLTGARDRATSWRLQQVLAAFDSARTDFTCIRHPGKNRRCDSETDP